MDVNDFLLKQDILVGTYALVKINKEETIPIWFSKNFENGSPCFLESPCTLVKTMKVEHDVDSFCLDYVRKYVNVKEDVDIQDYIDKFIKPMIIGSYLYEIENFQCSPFLPKNVIDIELISEEKCLNYILKNYYNLH